MQIKITLPCQYLCHLVLCYCQAATVLWQVADQADTDLFLYRLGAALFGKTQSRACCFSTCWLTLLCQLLKLFVLFWWDIKVKLDGISSWG